MPRPSGLHRGPNRKEMLATVASQRDRPLASRRRLLQRVITRPRPKADIPFWLSSGVFGGTSAPTVRRFRGATFEIRSKLRRRTHVSRESQHFPIL
jgi:hypothetical protein